MFSVREYNYNVSVFIFCNVFIMSSDHCKLCRKTPRLGNMIFSVIQKKLLILEKVMYNLENSI